MWGTPHTFGSCVCGKSGVLVVSQGSWSRRLGLRLLSGCVAGCVLVAGMVGVVGCGGSGAVVTFRGQGISRASFDHWVRVEAIISQELWPSQPPPAGEVPDPPSYRACIGYQRALALALGPKPWRGPKPSVAQLKQRCVARYTQVRDHMQQLLIGYLWTEAQAQAHGIKIPPATEKAHYQRYIQEVFQGPAGFRRYQHATGITDADELKMVRFDLQASALREKIIHEQGISGAKRFYHEYPRKLAAQTSCSAGYVIPECKQYKGPEPPIS